MSPTIRRTPVLGAALSAVAGGTLVVFALFVQQTALRVAPAPGVTALPPSAGPRTITLPATTGGEPESGTELGATALDAVAESLDTLLGAEAASPARTSPPQATLVATTPTTPSGGAGDNPSPRADGGRDAAPDVPPRAGGSVTQTLVTPDLLSRPDKDNAKPDAAGKHRGAGAGKDAAKKNAGKKDGAKKNAGNKKKKTGTGKAAAKDRQRRDPGKATSPATKVKRSKPQGGAPTGSHGRAGSRGGTGTRSQVATSSKRGPGSKKSNVQDASNGKTKAIKGKRK